MSVMKQLHLQIRERLEQGDSPIDRSYISLALDVPLGWVNEVADEMAIEDQMNDFNWVGSRHHY